SAPASFAARQRRSPAISSYPPSARGLTTTGCRRPWWRIDSASPAVASGSNRRRGCRAFGTISPTRISRISWPPAAPPTSNSPPPAARAARAAPRRAGGPTTPPARRAPPLDELVRHAPVRLGARRLAVVGDDRQPVRGRLGQPDGAGNRRPKDLRAEVAPHLLD